MAITRISTSSTYYTNYLYSITGDGWKSYADGMVYSSYCWGAITGVSYNSSTGRIDVSWKVGTCYNNGNVGGYYLARLQLWINGSSVWNGQGSTGSWYSNSYMVGVGTYEAGSGTTSIAWNGSSSQSISISVKAMYDWGYSDDRWNNYDTSNGSGSYTVSSLPTTPTGSVSISSVTRTGASYSVSASAGNGCTISSYTWSISPSATISNKSGASGTFSNLSANTSYTASCKVVNSAGLSSTFEKPFTTSGSAPSITKVTTSKTRTSFTLTPTVNYDTNDYFSSYVFKYATTSSGLSSATARNTNSATSLQPNTTYYYSLAIKSGWGRTSTAYTGTITTSCNAPDDLDISLNETTTQNMRVSLSAVGDTNAPVNNYVLYYKRAADSIYTSVPMGSSTTVTLNNLDVDTNYNLYFTAQNAGGTTTSSVKTFSTLLTSPEFTGWLATEITPFTCLVTIGAKITPTRELRYSFTKDGGSTWSAYQTSPTYQWTDLQEETEYIIQVRVKALHTGVSAVDTVVSTGFYMTTPADQAKVWIKTPQGWRQGKIWFKNNQQWQKGKKLFYKENNSTWTRSSNGEN